MSKLFLSYTHTDFGSASREFGNLVVDADEPLGELDMRQLERLINREKKLSPGLTAILYFQVMPTR